MGSVNPLSPTSGPELSITVSRCRVGLHFGGSNCNSALRAGVTCVCKFDID